MKNTMDHRYQHHSKQWQMKVVVELLILFLQTLNVSKVREWASGFLIWPILYIRLPFSDSIKNAFFLGSPRSFKHPIGHY